MDNLFATKLLDWFNQHGRTNLPWQHPRSPYAVLVSEMMLQQTQVQTVIAYFNRFMARFPDIKSLADAHEDEVLSLWQGLGYYSRARYLHRAANMIVQAFYGVFPDSIDDLIKLPGVGPSTAAAICSQAFDLPAAIFDGNVKRILSRVFMIEGARDEPAFNRAVEDKAKELMPKTRCCDYTQAMMDLGALVCKKNQPLCHQCPLNSMCSAYQHQKTEQYPAPKRPVNVIELHQKHLLIVNQNHEIWLQKRPDKGIWAGLFALPIIDKNQCEHAFLNDLALGDLINVNPFPHFSHRLTHRLLHILPVKISIANHQSHKNWHLAEKVKEKGLPLPVQKIITNYL